MSNSTELTILPFSFDLKIWVDADMNVWDSTSLIIIAKIVNNELVKVEIKDGDIKDISKTESTYEKSDSEEISSTTESTDVEKSDSDNVEIIVPEAQPEIPKSVDVINDAEWNKIYFKEHYAVRGIYFLVPLYKRSPVKIGMTTRNILKRKKEIQRKEGMDLEVYCSLYHPYGGGTWEKMIHSLFYDRRQTNDSRSNSSEWFNITTDDIDSFLNNKKVRDMFLNRESRENISIMNRKSIRSIQIEHWVHTLPLIDILYIFTSKSFLTNKSYKKLDMTVFEYFLSYKYKTDPRYKIYDSSEDLREITKDNFETLFRIYPLFSCFKRQDLIKLFQCTIEIQDIVTTLDENESLCSMYRSVSIEELQEIQNHNSYITNVSTLISKEYVLNTNPVFISNFPGGRGNDINKRTGKFYKSSESSEMYDSDLMGSKFDERVYKRKINCLHPILDYFPL